MIENRKNGVPAFVREALSEDPAVPDEQATVAQPLTVQTAAAVFERMSAPEPREADTQALLGQLRARGIEYAPFWDRVAELFGLDTADVEAFVRPGDFRQALLPGMRFKQFEHPQIPADRAALLVLMRPGFRYPRHRHDQAEHVLVLEGGYTDDSGRHYVAGDAHDMPDQSAHALRVDPDGPCVIAVLSERKLAFCSPILRLWARLVGW